MAIEEEVYGDFELENGERCRIELTTRGHYHIHIGNTLYSLSPNEFEIYADAILEGRKNLEELKGNE